MPTLKVVQQEDAAETKRRKTERQVLVARDHRGERRRPDQAAQCRASCAHLQGFVDFASFGQCAALKYAARVDAAVPSDMRVLVQDAPLTPTSLRHH